MTGSTHTNFGVTQFGVFLNDHWSVRPWLTLDLGVRYDIERIPSPLPQDSNNVSPRIGVAVTPARDWVVRAGYGIFFDRYVLAAINRVLQVNGTSASESILDAGEAGLRFRSGPNPVDTLPSIYASASSLPTPYSQQTSLSVEHLFARNWTASATYQFVQGIKLARTVNATFPLPPTPPPTNIYKAVFQLQDTAHSSYNGVALVLNRRMSNEIEFTGVYTWSKAIDDASDFNEQPQNPLLPRAERAVSRYDQRHRFVFSGLFDLPFGDEEDRKPGSPQPWWAAALGNIEVAPIVNVGSGRPVDPLTGMDPIHNLAFPLNVRPNGFGRNSLRTPFTATVDLRVLKYFKLTEHGKLDVVVESFNLFNRRNVTEIDPVFGAGRAPATGFGRPIEASNPRQVQFSIDFEF